MRMYSLYTPSHRPLVDGWFLPSLPETVELTLEEHPQECPTGEYGRRGWMMTMMRKVDLILRAIDENRNECVLHSDVDVQCFGNIVPSIEHALRHHDIVFMRDDPHGTVCAGFFACRCNEKVRTLWRRVRRFCQLHIMNDQQALNSLVRRERSLCWAYLPPQFFGGGSLTARHWNGSTCLLLPRDILVHHANWCSGIGMKIAQLQEVSQHVSAWQNGSKTGMAPLVAGSPLLHTQRPLSAFQHLRRKVVQWTVTEQHQGAQTVTAC